MPFPRRRVGVSLAAAALTAGAMLLGAPTAQAVTCSGSSCDGKDPQSTGCAASGTTVAQAQSYNWALVFELRYSSVCKTWWTRVSQILDTGAVGTIDVERNLTVYPGGTSYRTKTGQMVWTSMFLNASTYQFRACGRFESYNTACTGWYTRR